MLILERKEKRGTQKKTLGSLQRSTARNATDVQREIPDLLHLTFLVMHKMLTACAKNLDSQQTSTTTCRFVIIKLEPVIRMQSNKPAADLLQLARLFLRAILLFFSYNLLLFMPIYALWLYALRKFA